MATPKWKTSLKVVLLSAPFILGNIVSKNLFFTEVRVTPLDLLVLGIWILFFVNVINKKWKIHFDSFHKLFIITAIVSLGVSLLNFQTEYVAVGGMYLIRWLIYSSLYIPFRYLLKPSEGKTILKTIFLTLMGIGIAQYFLLPDTRFLSSQNWDDHYYRIIGSHLDPGFTGLLFVLGLIFFWFYARRIGVLIINYIALALTYSRTSYLAFFSTTIWFSVIYKNIKYVLVGVSLLLLTIIILPRPAGEGVKLERTNSVFARIENWKKAIQIGVKNPVIGVGFNTYRYAQEKEGYLGNNWRESHAAAGSDSSILFVFATTGLLGLCFYMLWYRSLFIKSSQFLKTILIVLFVHSWFLNSLFYVPILFLLNIIRIVDSEKITET